MLVAVQKGLVTRMLASLKTAGIVPDEISISTISVFNQVRSTIPPGSNTLVVNSDTGFAEAILIKDGHLMFPGPYRRKDLKNILNKQCAH